MSTLISRYLSLHSLSISIHLDIYLSRVEEAGPRRSLFLPSLYPSISLSSILDWSTLATVCGEGWASD